MGFRVVCYWHVGLFGPEEEFSWLFVLLRLRLRWNFKLVSLDGWVPGNDIEALTRLCTLSRHANGRQIAVDWYFLDLTLSFSLPL